MMKLPKRDLPSYNIELPVSKKTVEYRPYTIKEEKIIEMAQVGDNQSEKFKAVSQIIENCTNADPEQLHPADLQFLFLKLYSTSVSSDVKVVYTIGEDACGLQGDESKGPCQRTIETSFNIDKDVTVINLESLDKNSTVSKGGGRLVELVDGIKLQLNFVAVDIDETDANAFNSILYKLVESVIVPSEETPGEFDVMTKDDFTFEEFCDFMNSFRPSDLKNLRDFLTDTPTCSVEIKAKCLRCKKVFKSEESGLLGFFL